MKKENAIVIAITMITFSMLWTLPAMAWISRIQHGQGVTMCYNVPSLMQSTHGTVQVIGHGVDLATGVEIVNPSGLSASIVERYNGAQNDRRINEMIGSVVIRFSASENATTGDRKVKLTYPWGEDRFDVHVYRRAEISETTYTPPNGSFTDVDVKIKGT